MGGSGLAFIAVANVNKSHALTQYFPFFICEAARQYYTRIVLMSDLSPRDGMCPGEVRCQRQYQLLLMSLHYPLLLAYVAAIVLLIATPGPVVMLVLGTVARRGARQGFLTAVGANAASLVLITLAALMVFGVVLVSDRLLAWLQVAGCLFVAVLAIRTLHGEWRSGSTPGAEGTREPPSTRRRLPAAVHGFLVAIANPKDLLFFVAFFPQFTGITSDSRASLAILAALWIAVDFTILSGYIRAVRHPLMHRKQRWISASSAGFLLLIAIAGLADAMRGGMA
jgi:threonine/homoserine/homoserine lactone efflux protein